jgi:hypothetical protein
MKRSWIAWLSPIFIGPVLWPALTPCPQVRPAGASEAPAEQTIARLIEDLGNSRYEVREAATRALKEMEEAQPALSQALRSSDPEVRRRAADALGGIEERQAHRGLARAQALAKEGRITEAVERIVAFAGRDRQRAGGPILTQFAARLLEPKECDAHQFRDRFRKMGRVFPAGEFSRYFDAVHPREILGDKLDLSGENPLPIYARAEAITGRGFQAELNLVAAAGDFQAKGLARSVVIAGGNVVLEDAYMSIIVCDGDVEVRRGPGSWKNCLIVARGKVKSPRFLCCVVRSEDYFLDAEGKKVVIKEGTADPFGFVKFFELSDVGLRVVEDGERGEVVREGVRIKDIGKGTPFSAALQAGDVLTAIDGTKASSKEAFRKLLRKRMARGGPRITFTVLRAGKTMEATIPVKD